MRHWILQANPDYFDIRSALQQLDSIAWRLPKYAELIRPGDGVALWESGAEAGIVGIGTIQTMPAELPVPAAEMAFNRDAGHEGQLETRAVVAVRPIDPVAKSSVAEIASMSEHAIVVAPMGTVFPLSPVQWAALAACWQDPLPPLIEEPQVDGLPLPFAWSGRRNDTYPLPGGYGGHLDSLRQILDFVERQRPSVDELTHQLSEQFGSSASNARHISLFLRRVALVDEHAGLLNLSDVSRRWMSENDDDLIVAQIHARVRFVGEMLAILDQPRSIEEILAVAASRFGLNWTTKAQIQRRRGWLQSAGMIDVDDEGLLYRTPKGTSLLGRLSVYEGSDKIEPPDPPPEPRPPEPKRIVVPEQLELIELVERLEATAIASRSPDDFEYAIRDAFAFLGFRAEKLGGAGKTDVVADADLGRDASYRVIIDAKTTGRGAVSDSQIDWDTLEDHRALHSADYVAVVGPSFGSQRVADRAEKHNVKVVGVSDLIGLVRQHAANPMGLDAYRALFNSESSDLDLEALAAAVEEDERRQAILVAVLAEIEAHVSEVGPLSARDLYLLMRARPELDPDVEEIAEVLDALSSPVIGVLVSEAGSYRPAGSRTTAARRVGGLAAALEDSPS